MLHTALQNHPAVTTHSEGEEPNRRVVIMLKNQPERPEKSADKPQGEKPSGEKQPAERADGSPDAPKRPRRRRYRGNGNKNGNPQPPKQGE